MVDCTADWIDKSISRQSCTFFVYRCKLIVGENDVEESDLECDSDFSSDED